VATSNEDAVQTIAAKHGVECLHIGETMRDRLQIRNGADSLVDASVAELKAPWAAALEAKLHVQ
jgi:predicted kinase